MIEDVDKNIPNTSKFFETQGFNRLTKMKFNWRMVEASKTLELNIL